MPTSLIFVLLAAAWLVVLVPIVARRREKVPEMDESGARFRVLHRASTSMRRRRGPRRTEEVQTMSDTDENLDPEEIDELDDEDAGPLEQELLDEDEDTLETAEAEGAAEPEPAPIPEPVRREYAGAHPMRGSNAGAHPMSLEDDEEAPPAAVAVAERPQRRRHEPEQVEDVDDERYRPIPQRRGRGGYDPDAAERIRAFRYKQRRRVTAVMLLATIAFSLVAYLAKLPVLWSGTVVFGLLLVGYLAYLRRQVRIEDDIRQRRLAKMHRARQIRPEYHVSERTAARRPAAPDVQVTSEQRTASVPPSAYARNRHVVDLDDDDPGFDDLEYYEPYQYRRAAGQ